MTMRWLMTVQEPGIASPAGVEFDLTPRWLGHDEPPPHPNLFNTLRRYPKVVEIHRPDGTHMSAEVRYRSAHFNFAYEHSAERDEDGRVLRMRNPWIQQIVLIGISVAEVPPGSEIWDEVADEDIHE